MKTSRTSGPRDPPPTSTNITGVKRLRKKLQLADGAGVLTVADIGNCLPLNLINAEIRIMKLSAWASASAGSVLLVKFPIGFLPNSDGDNQTWVDEGTQGAVRPNIHLIPNFLYRSAWMSSSATDQVATFGGTDNDLIVVDITVEYRTAVQSCPGYDHTLERMRRLECCYDSVDGYYTPPDDPQPKEDADVCITVRDADGSTHYVGH